MSALSVSFVVHDEPCPHVEVTIVDALEDETEDVEAKEGDGELHAIGLQLNDVAAEGYGEKDAVLNQEDQVKGQLSEEG